MAKTFQTGDRIEATIDHINAYMRFMYNQWTEQICMAIFGAQLGDHIWTKWLNLRDDYSIEGAIFQIWFALDRKCTYKLLDAALKYYKL